MLKPFLIVLIIHQNNAVGATGEGAPLATKRQQVDEQRGEEFNQLEQELENWREKRGGDESGFRQN